MNGLTPDHATRVRAATATDRNIVVTAGAGTGKTTLLVSRLIHLLLHHPQPLKISEIVALTFTNKAATEMKVRLRAELFRAGHHELAARALRELEQSQIGTIHSFAAHLVRLYPVESGVDPSFTQDEGSRFREHVEREWTLWLDRELGAAGAHHEIWRAALRVSNLDAVKELAGALVGELIPLDGGVARAETAIPGPVRDWLIRLAEKATSLRSTHPKTNTLEHMLDETATCLQRILDEGIEAARAAHEGSLDRPVPGLTKSWSAEEHAQAKHILRTVQTLTTIRAGVLSPLLQIMLPFVADCRHRFVQRGYLSFDGLLARARTLLRDCPHVRRELKAQFRSVLVDEFQDTDPVQYEMMLYLAEAGGKEETDWRRVRLEPGKLFIVGDPKQSIYAFRRADMEAYDAVVEERVLAQMPPGERHTLRTNFRSHAALLGTINGFFETVFPSQPIMGLQPRYDPLLPYEPDMPTLAGERAELRVVRPEDPDADADAASRAEAEELARWLREDVLGRDEIYELGSRVTIKPGHVAILFRKLTGMRDYLEALRRSDIPCLAEGEKHFYERQEIIDAVNLLRAAANPHDRLALAGVLRSSLGAVPDVDLAALAAHGLLDYRMTHKIPLSDRSAQRAYDKVAPLYTLLRELNHDLARLPLTEVMDMVLLRTPLPELAAASMDQEQAVANLLRLRDIVAELAGRSDLTLQGLVAELTRRVQETPDEAESSLLEDATNGAESGAVRLLSIHKAKGLEFPMVILAGLHRGTDRQEALVSVHQDWSSGIVGVRLGDLQTVDGVYVAAKLAERRRYEHSRVLYVGMTRAKRRLILSAGLPKSIPSDSFLANVVQNVDDEAFDVEGVTAIPFGKTTIPLCVTRACAGSPNRGLHEALAWDDTDAGIEGMTARWRERDRRGEEAALHRLFVNPTALKETRDDRELIAGADGTLAGGISRDTARLIGTLAHRILEGWDFSLPPRRIRERIETVCRNGIPLDLAEKAESITAELHAMLSVFAASPLYADLGHAEILGREMPFSIPWNEGSQVMEGVIDLVYRLDGRVWVIDYKTDRVEETALERRAAEYAIQAGVYREAVAQSLGLDQAAFKLVFLRTGTAFP